MRNQASPATFTKYLLTLWIIRLSNIYLLSFPVGLQLNPKLPVEEAKMESTVT